MSKENIRKMVPRQVTVTDPDHRPQNEKLPGKQFLEGSPKGREANPRPKRDGGNAILT